MKKFLEMRKNWMKKNPILTARIAFVKGALFTILFLRVYIKVIYELYFN